MLLKALVFASALLSLQLAGMIDAAESSIVVDAESGVVLLKESQLKEAGRLFDEGSNGRRGPQMAG